MKPVFLGVLFALFSVPAFAQNTSSEHNCSESVCFLNFDESVRCTVREFERSDLDLTWQLVREFEASGKDCDPSRYPGGHYDLRKFEIILHPPGESWPSEL